jgi:hypothetical protein
MKNWTLVERERPHILVLYIDQWSLMRDVAAMSVYEMVLQTNILIPTHSR